MVSMLLLTSMSYLPSLSSLAIGLRKLRKEDLQVLGSMPSLRDLSIYVISRQGAEKRLAIDNSCPFRCLTRLCIVSRSIDFMFTQGTLQMLQILELDFDVEETKDRFRDFHFGMENLPSLEHVSVETVGDGALTEAMSNALRKMLDTNPNKPTLTVKAITSLYEKVMRYQKLKARRISDTTLSIEEQAALR